MRCPRPPLLLGILATGIFTFFGDVNLTLRGDGESATAYVLVGISQAHASKRDQASAEHRQACENFCKNTPECVRCSELSDCGPGQKDIKSWTGYGDNWYACAYRETREQASAQNRQACEDYCKSTPGCLRCSTLADCGPGQKDIKSWTGKGDNWHACAARETREEASAANKQACEAWCASHKGCHQCMEKVGCGKGYNNIKSWTGKGDNWYACQRTGSINTVWPDTSVARPTHRVLLVSMGGFFGYKDRDGFEWFCDDYFSGRDANPKVLCISSWGNISTRSETLSNNIADMASAIQRVSGHKPKIVLVGKSMGGCKLQHAATGIKDAKDGRLKNRDIDLFIGADMSCGTQRHFEKGEADALWFTNNVKKLLVFYQDKAGESMTGHQGIYVNMKFDPTIHINVAKNGLDVRNERRSTTNPPNGLCGNVTHLELDDCKPLLQGIRAMVIARTR